MAIGADLGGRWFCEQRLVIRRVDCASGMARHARRIDPVFGVHDLGRRAIAAGGPGFIGDVRVAVAVASGAADAGMGVSDRDLLVQVVGVADEASAVVSRGSCRCRRGWFIVQQ